MTPHTIKLCLTSLVLSLAVGGLLYTTMSESVAYYLHVDEVMIHPETWYGKTLQLHGFVVPGSILKRPHTLEYRFQMQHHGHLVHVTYTGLVPDTFRDAAEVVVQGMLSADGFTTQPNGVMAKCPSKYDARDAGI